MTKLMNLNLQNAEILDKKEMKQVTGGFGYLSFGSACMSDADCSEGFCENGICGGDNSDLRQKNIDACAHAT